MTYAEITEEVQLKVKHAPAKVTAKIPEYINEAIGEICSTVDLPDLIGYDTVTTLTDRAWVNMPTGFSGILLFAGAPHHKITICDSFESLLQRHPHMKHKGDVTHVAILGKLLYYQGIEDEALTMSVIFRKDPPALTDPADVPTYIPSYLHGRIIAPLAAMKVFDKIESVDEEQKVSRDDCILMYDQGLTMLQVWATKRRPNISHSVGFRF